MLLSDISVKRPIFATVISLLMVAFGVLSFQQIPVRELPDIDPPVVNVRTNYPGANALVVETRVTQLVEGAIAGVEGIDTIQSTSRDGESNVTIEFKLDRDIDAASNDVRDRVSRILNNLPEEVEPPEVSKADRDTRPIMWFNLLSDTLSTMQLTDYAERNLVDRLSIVDGVSTVRIGGSRRQAIRIHLDREAMAARQVTVDDVEQALRRENVELPAGRVESYRRDTIVRFPREYTTAADFNDLTLREGADGALVRLADVARIELGGERERRIFHGNGRQVVGLGIVKQSKANALDVTNAAIAEVDRLQDMLPESMELKRAYNSAQYIEDSINEVYVTFAIAMGLVVFVLYLFLGNLRSVLVPIVTVPVCIIASFFVMSLADVSINLITLLGLVLAIGLVVDDAIVVLENINRRVDAGEPGLLAAYRGARQVGFAVIATTLVLIGVFVPIMFLTDSTGRLFGEMAITMAGAVAFSSVVALTLTPMLCSLLVRRRNKKPAFARAINRFFQRVQNGYGALLDICLGNKLWMTGIFIACLALTAGIFRHVPQDLAPLEDRGYLIMRVSGPEGASIGYLDRQVTKVEEVVLPLRDSNELERFIIRVDTSGGFGFVILRGKAGEDRRSAGEIANALRRDLSKNAPGIRAFPFQTTGLTRGGSDSGFAMVIGGDTYEELARYSAVLLEELRDYPGLVNADVDYRDTQPQFAIAIDRDRAADLGVSISDIGRTLETMMGGRRVTAFQRDGEEYDVIVQAAENDRRQPLDMENIYVRPREGALVPLSSLLDVQETSGAGTLRRFNRVRSVTVSGELADGFTQQRVINDMQELIRTNLPDAGNIDYKGATRQYLESGSAIYFTFGMALVVVYLVMAAQFESFYHPIVIMLTVPLALLGGLAGLYLAGSTLNIYSNLGMVMLIGLAAKNGILIVEFANQLRDEGQAVRDALMNASKTRLRPILMTGLSTAIGALPLILADGPGSAARQTIGVTVFGGVTVATFFTLFVVPTFYVVFAPLSRSPNAIAAELEVQERNEGDVISPDHHEGTPAE